MLNNWKNQSDWKMLNSYQKDWKIQRSSITIVVVVGVAKAVCVVGSGCQRYRISGGCQRWPANTFDNSRIVLESTVFCRGLDTNFKEGYQFGAIEERDWSAHQLSRSILFSSHPSLWTLLLFEHVHRKVGFMKKGCVYGAVVFVKSRAYGAVVFVEK